MAQKFSDVSALLSAPLVNCAVDKSAGNMRKAESALLALANTISLSVDCAEILAKEGLPAIRLCLKAAALWIRVLCSTVLAFQGERRNKAEVTTRYEAAMRIIRDVRKCADSVVGRKSSIDEAVELEIVGDFREGLLSLTAWLLRTVVDEAHAATAHRDATAWMLFGCKWVKAVQVVGGSVDDESLSGLVSELLALEEKLEGIGR